MPLTVLHKLKMRTKKEPWELFDVIVGTSTGGILAVLLGLLKIPVETCVGIFEELGVNVFQKTLLKKIAAKMKLPPEYSPEPLEKAVRTILESVGMDPAIKLSELPPTDGRPRVVLVAKRESNEYAPYLFTNFSSEDADSDFLTADVTVCDAVRATSAAIPYFPAVSIRE